MTHYHETNDGTGDLVDLIPFCSDGCHQNWCDENSKNYEGWNGCHEHDHDEKCASCGRIIPGIETDPERPNRCDDCGIGVDASDGLVTEDWLVFCGGLYGNGCDATHLEKPEGFYGE
jgi:endogenous inhibitor of DNA gyrase (YacG/DUF329 family)